MRMSLQYQYMLDMEKERSQMALFKCYDFSRASSYKWVSENRKIGISGVKK